MYPLLAENECLKVKITRNPFHIGILFLALMLPSAYSTAQQIEHPHLTQSPQLSFDELLAVALENIPEYRQIAARESEAQAHQSVGSSWIAGRPSMSIDYLDDRVQSNLGQKELTYGVEVPLWRFGEKSDRQDLGQRYGESSAAWARSLELNVAGALRSALADYFEALAQQSVEQQASADAAQLLTIVEQLHAAGEVAQLEVMQARSLQLTQQRNELEADAMRVDAERNYAVLTGLTTIPANPHTEELQATEEIDANHPQLALLKAEVDLRVANVKTEEASARGNPSVFVGSRRQKDGPNTDYHNAFAVSVSIPFGGKTFVSAATSAARRGQVDAEVRYLSAQRDLATQLHEVEHQLFTLEQELPMGKEQAELSQQQWDMARSSFELGEADMSRVVIAMQLARNSAKEYESMLLQQQRLISEFNQIVGVLP